MSRAGRHTRNVIALAGTPLNTRLKEILGKSFLHLFFGGQTLSRRQSCLQDFFSKQSELTEQQIFPRSLEV